MASLNRNDPAAATRFELQTGGSSGVSSRISSVFDSLNGLEAKHKAWEVSRKEDSPGQESFLKEDPDVADDFATKSSSSSDGVFKRPWASPGGPCKRPRLLESRSGAGSRTGPANTAPDFKLHPERWTRYSLDSVSEEDMSEASNKAAAFDYLRERRLLKQQLQNNDDAESSGDAGKKHVFHKRPTDGDAEMEDESAGPPSSLRLGPGKLIMPECVVGAKPFGAKKTPRDTRQRSTSLPAGRSSSLISFDCADYDDQDGLEDGEAADEIGSRSADCGAIKKVKPRALRARAEDADD